MKEFLVGQSLFFYVETVLMLTGLFTLWISNMVYKRLIQETESMGTSEHKLVKYIKLKITSYFKLGMCPQNSQALMGRYIKKYRVGLWTLHSWVRFSQFAKGLMISVAFGVIMYQWRMNIETRDILEILMLTALEVSIVQCATVLSNFHDKEQLMMESMSDYVDNFLKNKLALEYKDQIGKVSPEQYKRALQEIAATETRGRKNSKEAYYYPEFDGTSFYSKRDEVDAKIVEDVLKEFLC